MRKPALSRSACAEYEYILCHVMRKWFHKGSDQPAHFGSLVDIFVIH